MREIKTKDLKWMQEHVDMIVDLVSSPEKQKDLIVGLIESAYEMSEIKHKYHDKELNKQ